MAIAAAESVTIRFVQPLAGLDGDTSGWSTSDSMVNLGTDTWSLLNGTANVTGFRAGNPGSLTHRGTRGLGIDGSEADEVDSVSSQERLEVRFASPRLLTFLEVRSLFAQDGPNDEPEQGDIDLLRAGSPVGQYHLVGTEPLDSGAPGLVNVSVVPSLFVDQIIYYVNDTRDYASYSEFAVARLDLASITAAEANASVYFEPEDIRVPAYCHNKTVGIWVNTSSALASGKLTFTYTFCCLNVTDFIFDSANFDPGVSGTMTVATLTPGQVELFFATGALEGLGPGFVHLGDATFHCCRESGEYCETDLAWVPDYPDSYLEDSNGTEITPVYYDDGIFRCNLPDLVITSVIGKKVNETHYTVNYTIKNIGASSVAAGHLASLTIDGLPVETQPVPDALAPGEEREYAFDSEIAVSGFFDTIMVCADDGNIVIEQDEGNNCNSGRYPAEVIVSVTPAITLVQPQEQFDVYVHVNPQGQEVIGIQYTLTYDTSVLRAETQTKGPFLGPSSETIVVVNNIDQAHGIVEYAETRKGEVGVTTAGNVSTIHFIAIGERGDTSWLNLSDVIVVDYSKEETELILENGSVEITENHPPIAIGSSKFLINNVAKKYPSTAILCSCSWDPDWPGKGGNITYIRWAFGDGQYGTSEGLPVENCTCKEHKYESWHWEDGAYLPFDVLLTVTDDGCPEATNSTTFPVTVYIAGDANGDGEVNILDAVSVGKHWRQTCPATDYCEDCEGYLWFAEQDGHWAQKDGADLNNDCEINILDAVVIGANWRHVAWE
jgi:hypothetical protein